MLQQTLPITVPLSPRETAPSFMSRIAQANGVDALTLGLELDLPFKKVIDGQHAEIRKLARLGGVDPEELAGWTPAKTENGAYAFRGAFFHGRTLRNPTVKGCPCCLKEDLAKGETMFLRGEWALPHVQSCPIHGHPLVPLWRDSHIHHRLGSAPRLDAIEDAIVAGELERDTRDVTPFEQWLDQKLAGHPGGNWLDAHSFHAAATFYFLLGYALSRHFTSAPSRIKKSDHWHLYQMGFVVASCGAPAVRSALTSLEDLSSSPSDGPLKVFPRLYAALANDHAEDPDFAPFRSLLREHILKTWPLGPGDELMGEPVLTRELRSLQTASRTTGVEAPRLRRVLQAAGVIGEASQSRADEWTVFSAAQASPLLRGRTELLAPERFCKSMSMEPELFQALAKSGTLKPAHEDKTTGAIWDPQSGAILLDRLLYGAPLPAAGAILLVAAFHRVKAAQFDQPPWKDHWPDTAQDRPRKRLEPDHLNTAKRTGFRPRIDNNSPPHLNSSLCFVSSNL